RLDLFGYTALHAPTPSHSLGRCAAPQCPAWPQPPMPVSIGEDDYLAHPHGLGEALKESGCALHTYVLMTNPVHSRLTPPQPNTSPGSSSRQGEASPTSATRAKKIGKLLIL